MLLYRRRHVASLDTYAAGGVGGMLGGMLGGVAGGRGGVGGEAARLGGGGAGRRGREEVVQSYAKETQQNQQIEGTEH